MSPILPVDESCEIVLEWNSHDEGDGSVNVSLNGIPCMRDTASPPNEERPARVPLKNLLPGDNILELEFTDSGPWIFNAVPSNSPHVCRPNAERGPSTKCSILRIPLTNP